MLLMLLASLLAAARGGEVTLDAGLVQTQVRDDLVVPLRSSGGGLALGVGWRHASGAQHARLHLGTPVVLFANRQGDLGGGYAVDLDASWDATIVTGASGSLSAGVAGHADLDEFFHAQWDDSHLYWQTHWGVGPRLAWRHPLGDDALEAWTSLPLVVVGSRPPARWQTKVSDIVDLGAQLRDAHARARVTSLNQIVDWHGGLGWRRPLRKGAIAVGAEIRVATTTWPERITTLSTAVTVERRFGRAKEQP